MATVGLVLVALLACALLPAGAQPAEYARVFGTLYCDANSSGRKDVSEPGLFARVISIDCFSKTGRRQTARDRFPPCITNSDGYFSCLIESAEKFVERKQEFGYCIVQPAVYGSSYCQWFNPRCSLTNFSTPIPAGARVRARGVCYGARQVLTPPPPPPPPRPSPPPPAPSPDMEPPGPRQASLAYLADFLGGSVTVCSKPDTLGQCFVAYEDQGALFRPRKVVVYESTAFVVSSQDVAICRDHVGLSDCQRSTADGLVDSPMDVVFWGGAAYVVNYFRTWVGTAQFSYAIVRCTNALTLSGCSYLKAEGLLNYPVQLQFVDNAAYIANNFDGKMVVCTNGAVLTGCRKVQVPGVEQIESFAFSDTSIYVSSSEDESVTRCNRDVPFTSCRQFYLGAGLGVSVAGDKVYLSNAYDGVSICNLGLTDCDAVTVDSVTTFVHTVSFDV